MTDNLARSEGNENVAVPQEGAALLSEYSFTRSSMRARRLRFLFACVVALVCVIVLVRAVQFLADQPRERAQRNYSYLQRVWHGAQLVSTMAWLNLNAAPDPFPQTRLPVFQLSISPQALEALNADLPSSGLQPQTAQLSLGADSARQFPVMASYTGISVNHWGMPWKSWSLKLGEGDYQRMSTMQLLMSRSDSQFENWLGNEMARRIGGILTPYSEFVHFRLNGKLNGVRLLLEPVTPTLPERQGKPKGKIFNGDITTAQIYDGVPREKLFSEPAGWDVKSPFPDDKGNEEIKPLIRLVQREHNPYEFYYQLPALIEVDALLRYMALLEIVSSVHIDETHNWKLYLNPNTKRFEPVVWNSVAYYWKNTKSIDLAPNELFRVVLSNPGLREAKDRILWDAINGSVSEDVLDSVVTSEYERIKPDMHASYLKWDAGDRGIHVLSNAEWDRAIEELRGTIRARHAFLRAQLTSTDARFKIAQVTESSSQFAVQINSRSGVVLDTLQIALKTRRAGIPVTIRRRGLEDLKRPIQTGREVLRGMSDKNGVVTLKINDSLSSKRRIVPRRAVELVPATYVYEINTPRGVGIEKVVAIKGRNSVNGAEAQFTEDSSLEISSTHRPNIVWWSPEEFIKQ